MNHRIIRLLIAIVMGLTLLSHTSCNSPERQLESALKEANKGFPLNVATGVTLEGFFENGQAIDIAVTVREENQTKPIDSIGIKALHTDFLNIFTQAAHQQKELADFFGLITQCNRSLTLTVTCMPSGQKHQTAFTTEEIASMIAASTKSSAEMAVEKLDIFLEAQAADLPMEVESVIIKSVKHEGQHVVWDIAVTDPNYLVNLKRDVAFTKNVLLEAQDTDDNSALNEMALAADCDLVFRYSHPSDAEPLEITITKDDLREMSKKSKTTQLQ